MHSATAKSLYQLADLLSHSPQVRERAHAALPAEIRSLDAGEIWHASMLLGLAVEATGDGNVNDLRTRFIRGSKEASAPQIMSAGFFLLQDLDEYFDDLVTEIRDKAKLAPSLSPVRAELGILHDLIDPAVVGDATTAIFEARLKRYYRSRYRFNDTRTSAIVLLRWCDQVMSSDEVVNGAPSKFAARRMMTFRELRVGRGAIYKAYDRSSVETLIDGLRDAKAMSILMTESGMPRKVFDRLIEAGRLRPAATLVARLLGPGRVSDSDWRAWLHAVESGIQSPQGSTAIKFSAAVRLLGGGAVGWNRVLDLIEKGHVPLISVNDQTTRLGLRWNVCRRRLGEHLPRHDGESGASLTAVLASEGIRASKALELARLKVVQTTTAATIPPVALLEQAELRRFKENYVTAATLSAELGLALKIVPLWLREGGVSIIGNGRPVIYHRADVEALLDKGVRLYRNIGRPASPQTIAQLQYLKVPGDITIDFVSNKQSHVTPQKLPQIRMLLDILEGRSFDQIADAVGKQAIQTFCFSTRRRGVEHHVSRRKTSKSRLSSEQRMLLEKEIRRFISAKNADVRISQAKLVEHVRETFGIDYDKTSISAIVRRSGMTWPTDVRVLSRLTESQRVAFKSYSQSIADRIRAGEPGLSRKTLIKWIEDQFDIRVSLASVTKYNRDLGVDWPRIAGQKIHKIVRVDVKVR